MMLRSPAPENMREASRGHEPLPGAAHAITIPSMGSAASPERGTEVVEQGAPARSSGAFAAAPSAPARSPGLSPTAVLALQRTIGNARVGRVLKRRQLQRTYEADFRTLLGQAPLLGDPEAQAALAALQTPALQNRAFTRHDTARWLSGSGTVAEWSDLDLQNVMTPLLNLGQSPLASHVTDFNNREALRELQAFATSQRNALDALLAAGGNAGAPWTQKFTAMRTAVDALKTRVDAMNYAAQLAAAPNQDQFRTSFAAGAEAKLALLRLNQEQIRFGGRLKFSQKRANARFSSAATVHNEATNALVGARLVSEVAQDLRNGTIVPSAITVQVFERGGDLIAINNRGLAALSLAGMRPVTVVPVANPSAEILGRLGESDTYTSANGSQTITAPDFQMALTMTDARTDRFAVELPVTH
jgi:hypothetical protein